MYKQENIIMKKLIKIWKKKLWNRLPICTCTKESFIFYKFFFFSLIEYSIFNQWYFGWIVVHKFMSCVPSFSFILITQFINWWRQCSYMLLRRILIMGTFFFNFSLYLRPVFPLFRIVYVPYSYEWVRFYISKQLPLMFL